MVLPSQGWLLSLIHIWLIEQRDMEEYGLRSFWVADGPSGIRRRKEADEQSIPLICYPSASTYACSWDRELMRELGPVSYTHLDVYKRQVYVRPGKMPGSMVWRTGWNLSLIHI